MQNVFSTENWEVHRSIRFSPILLCLPHSLPLSLSENATTRWRASIPTLCGAPTRRLLLRSLVSFSLIMCGASRCVGLSAPASASLRLRRLPSPPPAVEHMQRAMPRECVLFIGTQFSILYTSVYLPARAAYLIADGRDAWLGGGGGEGGGRGRGRGSGVVVEVEVEEEAKLTWPARCPCPTLPLPRSPRRTRRGGLGV